MIASLSGVVQVKKSDRVVVDVHGVGYELFVPGRVIDGLPASGQAVFLHVHTSVREDAITLFGFVREEEKQLFLILTGVTGIGPKLALAMLSAMNGDTLCAVLAARDVTRLSTIPGIGKKIAQRLCVELQDKVAGIGTPLQLAPGMAAPAVRLSDAQQDAASALVNLGYTEAQAWQAVTAAAGRCGDETAPTVERLIREALRSLV
jgi:Holliday junction DNA helicase RuvA